MDFESFLRKACVFTKNGAARAAEAFNLRTKSDLKHAELLTDAGLIVAERSNNRFIAFAVTGVIINAVITIAYAPVFAATFIAGVQLVVSLTNKSRIRHEIKRRKREKKGFEGLFNVNDDPCRDFAIGYGIKAVSSVLTLGIAGLDHIAYTFQQLTAHCFAHHVAHAVTHGLMSVFAAGDVHMSPNPTARVADGGQVHKLHRRKAELKHAHPDNYGMDTVTHNITEQPIDGIGDKLHDATGLDSKANSSWVDIRSSMNHVVADLQSAMVGASGEVGSAATQAMDLTVNQGMVWQVQKRAEAAKIWSESEISKGGVKREDQKRIILQLSEIADAVRRRSKMAVN